MLWLEMHHLAQSKADMIEPRGIILDLSRGAERDHDGIKRESQQSFKSLFKTEAAILLILAWQ